MNNLTKIRIDDNLENLENIASDIIANLSNYELVDKSNIYKNRDNKTGRIYLSFIKKQ